MKIIDIIYIMNYQESIKPKVFVAMSGGVDSSVAAALLKKRGYKVTGVFFKPWQPDNGLSFCNWGQDRQDALKVAIKIKIPFLTWDFSKEYYKRVTKYMIGSYKNGTTPNPDVMCNKEIKFGLFLKKALEMGADYIATGHYVRLRQMLGAKCLALLTAKDVNKDQSYFLWTLTQEQLKHCLFPVGDYKKPEIRLLAKKFGLPNWDKKDSQGICFVGDLDMKEFLREYIKTKPGLVKNMNGKIIGEHEGMQYYTIGQRHGFKIKEGDKPCYIVKKDYKKNILFADTNKSGTNLIKINKVSWVQKTQKLPFYADVKIRYRNDSQRARISKHGSNQKLVLRFKKAQCSITPGQSAVFYNRKTMLGGGIII